MVPAACDHLMYGGGLDLDALRAEVERRTGVRAAAGGRHDTAGTHNALLGLGGARYLELIAADPEGDPGAALGRLIAGLERPRIVSWAVAVDDLDRAVAHARAAGYDPGPIRPLRRRRPDGSWLAWRLAWESDAVMLGIVPFLIDWGDCEHPAPAAPSGCHLQALRAEHPDPAAVTPILAALDVDLDVTPGEEPRLIAILDTPTRVVELR